jgi:hypothetical protein
MVEIFSEAKPIVNVMADAVKSILACKELKDKTRCMCIVIENKHKEYELNPVKEMWFETGKIWKGEAACQAGEDCTWIVCNKDHNPRGVSGGVTFRYFNLKT